MGAECCLNVWLLANLNNLGLYFLLNVSIFYWRRFPFFVKYYPKNAFHDHKVQLWQSFVIYFFISPLLRNARFFMLGFCISICFRRRSECAKGCGNKRSGDQHSGRWLVVVVVVQRPGRLSWVRRSVHLENAESCQSSCNSFAIENYPMASVLVGRR